MKSTELRIGNYVNEWWCADNKYYVKKLDINLFRCVIEDWTEWEPIPLTEEWLVKFGFEPNIYNDEFELYPLTFDCEYTDEGSWNISYDSYPLSTEIKHVHQLQNLYFALTGEELTLKNEDK